MSKLWIISICTFSEVNATRWPPSYVICFEECDVFFYPILNQPFVKVRAFQTLEPAWLWSQPCVVANQRFVEVNLKSGLKKQQLDCHWPNECCFSGISSFALLEEEINVKLHLWHHEAGFPWYCLLLPNSYQGRLLHSTAAWWRFGMDLICNLEILCIKLFVYRCGYLIVGRAVKFSCRSQLLKLAR